MEPEQISFSKNRLFYSAILVAILNPLFAGVIFGIILLTNPKSRREGWIILGFSIVWGAIALALAFKLPGLPQ
jgi:Na+/H+-dicarboxylate symporter